VTERVLFPAMSQPVEKQATKTEDAVEYPAEAYAYVGDPEVVSTWKLRLWQTPELRETATQIGMAVAALGPGGFRGNRVRIPARDLADVKRRVLRAWLKVHEGETRDDAPRVLLSSRPVVHTPDEKEADMAEPAQPQHKEHGGPGPDAMTYLLMAYRQMIDHPECEPLLAPLMDIVHALEAMMTASAEDMGEEMVEEPAEEAEVTEGGGYGGGGGGGRRRRRRRMQKIVAEEDGQWCVRSDETGRSFGCYATQDQAQARLAQIESFTESRIAQAADDDLVRWHAALHELHPVTAANKAVHDLVEDELEGREIAPPYDLGDADEKLALLASLEGAVPIHKQAEQRYTLGPVYVPGLEDAHGEFTDEVTLQKALWDWIRKGDRAIYMQHSEEVAGEMVEMLTWPFEIEAALEVPGQGATNYSFPADTPFMGVVWKDWAWDQVKAGELRGYSIGGVARRMEADLPVAALA